MATRFCQILANFLSCQVVFKACDNRYGDKSPCFIAGSLVVNYYVFEVICVLVVCFNPACFHCRRVAFSVLKPCFSFYIFVLNLSCLGFIINVEFFCLSADAHTISGLCRIVQSTCADVDLSKGVSFVLCYCCDCLKHGSCFLLSVVLICCRFPRVP